MQKMANYWNAIFSQIADAAEHSQILNKLKTADLPEERRVDQINKLKETKKIHDASLELPKGGFVSRFKVSEETFLAIHTPGLSANEIEDISSTLASYATLPEYMDESNFMFLSFEHKEFLKLRQEYLNKVAARAITDIALEDEYEGHEFNDVVQLFEEFLIYKIDKSSSLIDCSKWFIGALLATTVKSLRAESFPPLLAETLKKSLEIGNINPENIYYAATSIHQRQCFMEIYRCIEGIYYLPWINILKTNFKITENGRSIAAKLKSDMNWRHKEADSIMKIFETTSEIVINRTALSGIEAFKDIDIKNVELSAIGRRFYKIRNLLVHQEDYDDPAPIDFTTQCWPTLNITLANLINDLFSRYPADLDFEYKIPPLKTV